ANPDGKSRACSLQSSPRECLKTVISVDLAGEADPQRWTIPRTCRILRIWGDAPAGTAETSDGGLRRCQDGDLKTLTAAHIACPRRALSRPKRACCSVVI